jgi:HEAT repeat protein
MSGVRRYAAIGAVALAALVAGAVCLRPGAPKRASASVPPVVSTASVEPWRAARDTAHDDAARTRAFELAAHDGSTAAAALLVEEARSDSPLAVKAAASLGRVESAAACGALASSLETGSTLVRANALRALGNAGGCGKADLLARLVADPSQPIRIRQEAALALAKTHDPSATQALLTTLRSEASSATPLGEQLRLTLIQAVGATGSAEGREFLEAYAKAASSMTERAFAARYL